MFTVLFKGLPDETKANTNSLAHIYEFNILGHFCSIKLVCRPNKRTIQFSFCINPIKR